MEKRLRKERRERSLEENTLGPKNPQEDPPLEPHFEQNLEHPIMGQEAREKTLRELFEPDINQKPSTIVVLPTTHPFELKFNILSRFQSLGM